MRFKPDLESLVLAALGGGAKHGYDIAKTIRAAGSKALKVGDGQLYPILHALEERGWVASEWLEQEGRPNRKVYSVTPEGKKELGKRRLEWAEFSASVIALLGVKEVPCG
ncbi:MAG: PadR family transcriptional regulator [Fimbriimonadaceae bacterium]|nr:PadR family transcriptional regulator [Fimbriimonadaceae bacterium]